METDSKSKISKSFEIIFEILFGLLLTEHLKNLANLFITKGLNEYVIVAITIFLLLSFFLLETFLDFATNELTIESKYNFLSIIRYTIWYLQFLPLVYVVQLFTVENIEKDFYSHLFKGLSLIYVVYILINSSKAIILKNILKKIDSSIEKDNDEQIKEIRKELNKSTSNIFLYIGISLIIFFLGNSILKNPYREYLTILILGIVLTFYLYHFKSYYKKRF